MLVLARDRAVLPRRLQNRVAHGHEIEEDEEKSEGPESLEGHAFPLLLSSLDGLIGYPALKLTGKEKLNEIETLAALSLLPGPAVML
jgi:hypothetical protein